MLFREQFMRTHSLSATLRSQYTEQEQRQIAAIKQIESEIMAITCHEVRNPLNGAVGHLRLAAELLPPRMAPAAASARGGMESACGGTVSTAGGGSSDEGSEGLAAHVRDAEACTMVALRFLQGMNSLHKLKANRLQPREDTFPLRQARAHPRPLCSHAVCMQ